jgi:hypothetical protein
MTNGQETAAEAPGGIPPELLEAIAAADGGRVVFILGAGCSFEQPTGLELADVLARRCHDELVANHDLEAGECHDPDDLSVVADAVFAKHGSQRKLVELFTPDKLKNAEANEGYELAAIMLREKAVSSVLTLNYDLAAAHALEGAGGEVGIIEGPEEHERMRGNNLVFLHRSITRKPDDLIIRTEQLNRDWEEGHWEKIVAERFVGGSVTVFVGLGTPAAVLVDTAKRIIKSIGDKARFFVVGPGSPEDSKFFQELELEEDLWISMGWCEFATALAARLLASHVREWREASAQRLADGDSRREALGKLAERFDAIGIVRVGRMRARWLMRETGFAPRPREPELLQHLAELLNVAALFAARLNVMPTFDDAGTLEFAREAGSPIRVLLLTTCGTKEWSAVEATTDLKIAALKREGRYVSAVVIGGFRSARNVLTPASISSGDPPAEPTIVDSPPSTQRWTVEELEAAPALIDDLAA